jgi:hypothetical protein
MTKFRRKVRPSRGKLVRSLALTLSLAAASLVAAPFSPVPALAQEPLKSNSYEIQLGNFNMTSGEKSGGGYKVTDTVGQTAAGEFNSTGYNVYAGFQYLYTLTQFSFEISDLTIDLGELSAGNFSTGSHTLKVTTRSGGYRITASADSPLETAGGLAFIPFTSCDSGCSISTAAPWTNTSHSGFGFSASGSHVAADFVNSTYFRPFADLSNAETPQTIATATTVVRNDLTTITYQATINGSTTAGEYETAITYNAIPSY